MYNRPYQGPVDAAAHEAANRQSHRGRALHGSTEHTPDELIRAARSVPHDLESQRSYWHSISRHVGPGAILTLPDDLPLLTPDRLRPAAARVMPSGMEPYAHQERRCALP